MRKDMRNKMKKELRKVDKIKEKGTKRKKRLR